MKKGLHVFILAQSALPPSLAAVLALTEDPPELLEHAKRTAPASSAAETREEAMKGMRLSIGIAGPGYPMKGGESFPRRRTRGAAHAPPSGGLHGHVLQKRHRGEGLMDDDARDPLGFVVRGGEMRPRPDARVGAVGRRGGETRET